MTYESADMDAAPRWPTAALFVDDVMAGEPEAVMRYITHCQERDDDERPRSQPVLDALLTIQALRSPVMQIRMGAYMMVIQAFDPEWMTQPVNIVSYVEDFATDLGQVGVAVDTAREWAAGIGSGISSR